MSSNYKEIDWIRELQNVSARLVNIVTTAAQSKGSSSTNASSSASASSASSAPQQERGLAYDVVLEDERILVTIELPGVEKEKVQLTTGGHRITLSGEKPSPDYGSGRVVRSHRKYGRFEERIELPSDEEIDFTAVSATMTDGVLTVVLPLEGGSRRTINID